MSLDYTFHFYVSVSKLSLLSLELLMKGLILISYHNFIFPSMVITSSSELDDSNYDRVAEFRAFEESKTGVYLCQIHCWHKNNLFLISIFVFPLFFHFPIL